MTDRADEIAREIAKTAFIGEGNIHANDIVDEIRAYGDERSREEAERVANRWRDREPHEAAKISDAALERAAVLCEKECRDEDGCWTSWFAEQIRNLKEKP